MRKIIRRYPFGVVYQPEPGNEQAEVPARSPHPGEPVADVPVAPPPGSRPEAARFDWLCEAARQPGKAAQLALMLAWQAAQASSPAVKPARRGLRRFGVSRDACYDGLRRLEDAGLVHVWRLPGRLPQVVLVEPGTDQPLRLQ
jgi:hypothetical protein